MPASGRAGQSTRSQRRGAIASTTPATERTTRRSAERRKADAYVCSSAVHARRFTQYRDYGDGNAELRVVIPRPNFPSSSTDEPHCSPSPSRSGTPHSAAVAPAPSSQVLTHGAESGALNFGTPGNILRQSSHSNPEIHPWAPVFSTTVTISIIAIPLATESDASTFSAIKGPAAPASIKANSLTGSQPILGGVTVPVTVAATNTLTKTNSPSRPSLAVAIPPPGLSAPVHPPSTETATNADTAGDSSPPTSTVTFAPWLGTITGSFSIAPVGSGSGAAVITGVGQGPSSTMYFSVSGLPVASATVPGTSGGARTPTALSAPDSISGTFKHNTGGIVGIALGATMALLLGVLFTFFACRRRFKSTHRRNISKTWISSPLPQSNEHWDDAFSPVVPRRPRRVSADSRASFLRPLSSRSLDISAADGFHVPVPAERRATGSVPEPAQVAVPPSPWLHRAPLLSPTSSGFSLSSPTAFSYAGFLFPNEHTSVAVASPAPVPATQSGHIYSPLIRAKGFMRRLRLGRPSNAPASRGLLTTLAPVPEMSAAEISRPRLHNLPWIHRRHSPTSPWTPHSPTSPGSP
ncbi:hypothetical protein GGX14DRAFT_465791 [Mycena pura]|uniref:Uncharacterized protein n=1 Tax=Mycena pura TaxID=153505 RepID=A0AAD6V6L6_9AGAR|nr:hypothetical protein GGX14DRAFT_465791 [Mycena pura]